MSLTMEMLKNWSDFYHNSWFPDIGRLLIDKTGKAEWTASELLESLTGHPAEIASLLSVDMRLTVDMFDAGASPNYRSTNGHPAFLSACDENLIIARMFIAYGADVNMSYEGYTALHFVARTDLQIGFLRLLIKHGADVCVRDDQGVTPLHVAAVSGHSNSCAEVLLSHGADINARDNKDRSPLCCAVALGHARTVSVLLNNGAEIEPQCKDFGWNRLWEMELRLAPNIAALIEQRRPRRKRRSAPPESLHCPYCGAKKK